MSRESSQKIVDMLHEMDQRAAYALMEEDYDKALGMYKEILSAQEALKLEKLCGHTMLNMANIYLIKEDFDTAMEYIEKVSQIKIVMKDDVDRGNIEMFRANALFMYSDAKEAEKILLSELKKNKNHTSCGKMQLILYSYYMRENMKVKARTILEKAIGSFRVSGNKDELKRALTYRMNYFLSVGQPQYAKLDEAEIARI